MKYEILYCYKLKKKQRYIIVAIPKYIYRREYYLRKHKKKRERERRKRGRNIQNLEDRESLALSCCCGGETIYNIAKVKKKQTQLRLFAIINIIMNYQQSIYVYLETLEVMMFAYYIEEE